MLTDNENRQLGPLTRAVKSGSGNRALVRYMQLTKLAFRHDGILQLDRFSEPDHVLRGNTEDVLVPFKESSGFQFGDVGRHVADALPHATTRLAFFHDVSDDIRSAVVTWSRPAHSHGARCDVLDGEVAHAAWLVYTAITRIRFSSSFSSVDKKCFDTAS